MGESNSRRNDDAHDTIVKTLESVLRPKFRFSSSAVEANEETEYREAVAKAYAIVKRRVEDHEKGSIDDLEAYAATVAHNVFNGFLKKKYPVRNKLAIEIRTALNLHPQLAYWIIVRSHIGGKRAWKGQPIRLESKAKLALENADRAARECFKGRQPGSLLISDLLLEFFDWIRHPFGYDHTVNFCFTALGLREAESSPLTPDENDYVDIGSRSEESANARELAEFIWAQIQTMEPVRRGIFLLFEPPAENQDAVCDQLILHGVCSLTDIARAAGISFEQYGELRRQTRTTYDVVASLYNISAKQAENIRRGVTDLIWRRLKANGFRQEPGSAK